MKARYFAVVFFILSLSSTVFGQQAKLEGHIYEIVNTKQRPVVGVRVIAPSGQSKETDSKGHFVIDFPNSILPGQATRIEVSRPGWVVRDPLFGDCTTINPARNFELLEVIIVPKGSPLALEPKQLSKVIARWADERVKLRAQVTEQKGQLDEYAFLREYAEKYGFTLEQFKDAADRWAKIKESDDKEERALKEYWQRNYAGAARLALESGDATVEELKRLKNERIVVGRNAIRRYQLAGNSFIAYYEFREALNAYGKIETLFSEGMIAKEDLSEEWAKTKNLLGNAKSELGTRVEGQESKLLLGEAVTAYHEALKVRTREQFPQDWALTQNNLGVALRAQGERASGEESRRLLGESVTAYREALKVFTREQSPQSWAAAQNNVGAALWAQGQRAGGEESVRLLGESVTALREALKVRTREQLPQQWAMTQNNLGLALQSQGERSGGEESVQLLGEAVTAFREALKVRTREQSPQQWAMTQNSLGKAYLLLKNWQAAAVCFEDVLTLYPSHEEGYLSLAPIYHERLFEYAKAFELHRQWLSRFPQDTSALADFAETHFTTGRFSEFSRRIKPLLADPALPAGAKIALQMIEVANLLALDNADQVPAALTALNKTVSDQKADFQIDWSFSGALNFINSQERFVSYRPWLNRFFSAAQEENRDAIVKALREVRTQIPATSGKHRR
jgi:tetratricopeptide (TPR) repeat protein